MNSVQLFARNLSTLQTKMRTVKAMTSSKTIHDPFCRNYTQFINLRSFSRFINNHRTNQSRSWSNHPSSSPPTASAIPPTTTTTTKKKVVFLGTPEVAALVLQRLINASSLPDSSFNLTAVVTQPGRPRGRGQMIQPSPVETLALQAGLPNTSIFTPLKATDPHLLDTLHDMQPDLCITAAYGNYLPTSFLKIPLFGTLNIHPSLLPKFRGAAPVQRALESGLSTTGVTVLYTVKEMDAGPILAQKEVDINGDVQAPQLLNDLFEIGTDLLLHHLPRVWSGEASQNNAQAQDASQATHAAKIEKQEGILDFSNQSAYMCHSKVKGFAGWPGTVATFYIQASDSSNNTNTNEDALDLKIIKTRVVDASSIAEDTWSSNDDNAKYQVVAQGKQGLLVKCEDGSVLQIIEVQPPGKKPMSAQSFANGLKGRKMYWKKK